jgi:hypothetical protein
VDCNLHLSISPEIHQTERATLNVSNAKPRLAIDPACAKALMDLERITTVDECSFFGWMHANERRLKCRFSFSDEWDDQAGAWLRFEYVRELGRIP